MIDPGDQAQVIAEAVRGLDLVGIALTHAHFDHLLALPELARRLDAPIIAHRYAPTVWAHELEHLERAGHWDAGTGTAALLTSGENLHPEADWQPWDGIVDLVIEHGSQIRLGSLNIDVLATPGHTPDGLTFAADGHLFTGDTLFPGGPGLTGPQWEMSDFTTIMGSVSSLFKRDASVHPGHGPSTTTATERPHLATWKQRGW